MIMLAGDSKEYLKFKTEKFGLQNYFNSIYCTCYEGIMKDDPEIYSRVIKKERLKADECLFIDDIRRFIRNAKSIGMNAIHFHNSKQLEKELKKLGLLNQNP